jgi:hypothetical protein
MTLGPKHLETEKGPDRSKSIAPAQVAGFVNSRTSELFSALSDALPKVLSARNPHENRLNIVSDWS